MYWYRSYQLFKVNIKFKSAKILNFTICFRRGLLACESQAVTYAHKSKAAVKLNTYHIYNSHTINLLPRSQHFILSENTIKHRSLIWIRGTWAGRPQIEACPIGLRVSKLLIC